MRRRVGNDAGVTAKGLLYTGWKKEMDDDNKNNRVRRMRGHTINKMQNKYRPKQLY